MDLDLEKGGGNDNDAVAVLRPPDRAGPYGMERQPFTWLRAAPYVAATLAGVALFAVSLVLVCRSCSETTECRWGLVLVPIAIVVMAAIVAFTGWSVVVCVTGLPPPA